MRKDREQDPRLLGGIYCRTRAGAGVLYNSDGAISEALATPHNTTVTVLTRNRADYLKDLLDSIEHDLPSYVYRHVLVNNTTDNTLDMLGRHFGNWTIDVVHTEMFPRLSSGFNWIRQHKPEILPTALLEGAPAGYGPTESIAWLRNRMTAKCPTRFLISFDDDVIVKPGWFDYLLNLQNQYYSFGVINNFASFLLDTAVTDHIGWFDERFVRCHGYEDNDFTARLNEKKLRWVLGFNENHDWRSAEEGNPRGSGTGSDLFVHRYARLAGGFCGRQLEDDLAGAENHFANRDWYRKKWQHVEGSGVQDRPPFKGYFLERKVFDEPIWQHRGEEKQRPTKDETPRSFIPGKKTTQNTKVTEIDPFERPATSTMVDRYLFFSHWCKGKRVLDAGCGHGYGSALLYSLGANSVVGMDADESAIDGAIQRYQRPGLDFIRANLLEPPLSFSDEFDCIVCVEVFEHLTRANATVLLDRLRYMLRDQGTLLVTTPRRKTREWHGDGGTHLYEYTCGEFREALDTAMNGSSVTYAGIQEFQIRECPQWFSRWYTPLDDDSTVMVAVAENLPRLVSFDESRKSTLKLSSPDGPESLPRMSILIPNRNTLPFLKLAIRSCREYLARADHELIVYDDASTDGSLEWLKAHAGRYEIKILHQAGPERKGIVHAYDELVSEASCSVVLLAHSDMFFAQGADAELWRHFGPSTVATCTRIEPPLFADEPYRLLHDFGMDARTFREEEFLRFAETQKDPQHTTMGIFAPLMMGKDDYLALGGHDKLFAPQSREDSDLFNRMQMAGLRFVQCWSAFCYHFSGRGSRKKDSYTVDSEEWLQSNAKNERNFIRKWGTSVRHDCWLKPIVVKRQRISLLALLGNETEHVLPWISHLEPYFDEIVLVDDSSDASAAIASQYIEREAALSSLVTREKLIIVPRPLAADFAAARNAAQQSATFDWVLHMDLDERLDRQSLESLQELIESLQAAGKSVCGFPRLNLLDGVVANDLPRRDWNPRTLQQLRSTAQPNTSEIRNLDLQFRLLRRDVPWVNRVHEKPHPVVSEQSATLVAHCPAIWIRHEKSLRRQARQDLFYQKVGGMVGSQAEWDPQQILELLGAT